MKITMFWPTLTRHERYKINLNVSVTYSTQPCHHWITPIWSWYSQLHYLTIISSLPDWPMSFANNKKLSWNVKLYLIKISYWLHSKSYCIIRNVYTSNRKNCHHKLLIICHDARKVGKSLILNKKATGCGNEHKCWFWTQSSLGRRINF